MKTLSTLLLSALALCTCAQPVQAPARLSGTSPLVEHFERAAAAVDMPSDVLALWAHMETRFVAHPDDGDGHGQKTYGVMGLSDALVEKGAALLGEDASAVRTSEDANIRATAALIRSAADGTGRIEGQLSSESAPLQWIRAMAHARVITPESLEDSYIRLAAETLGKGVRGVDASGRTIVVDGRGTIRVPARSVVVQGIDPQDPYSARYIQSTNYRSGRSASVDTIVIHTTQGSYAGTVSWFQNPAAEVSAHYVIRSSDGEITQMVMLEDTAWHVGTENAHTVGIEHEGYVDNPAMWYTDVMYTRSAQLTRWLCEHFGLPLDRNHIKGHVELPNQTHTDPGSGWDWNRYMELVTGAPVTMTDRRVVGVVYDATQGTSTRIAGATVTLLDGSTEIGTATSSSTGFWAFNVNSGTFTVRAVAQGFAENTRMATASTTGDNWASIGLSPGGQPATGIIRGIIYSGATAGQDPVDGATVTLSSGETMTVGTDGAFRFDIPAGTVTVTARKTGYVENSLMRTVVAGTTVWASVQLVPEMMMPPQDPPPTPNPISPVGDAEVDGAAVLLSFSRVSDPNGLEVTYDVELYRNTGANPLFALGAAQSATSPVTVSIPVALDPDVYSWRVRARSGAGQSAWSARANFQVAELQVGTSSSAGGASSTAGVSSSSAPASSEMGSSGFVPSSTSTDQGPQNQSKGDDDDDGNPSVGGCSAADVEGSSMPAVGMLMLAAALVRVRRRQRPSA